MQKAQAKCPVKRLWISSMTDEAIRDGFRTLKDQEEYKPLYLAGTPTLALIVNRQKEIDNFKPEPYWVLSTVYRDTLFTATKGKFTNKEEGEQSFAQIEGKPFTITDVQKKAGREAPPHL